MAKEKVTLWAAGFDHYGEFHMGEFEGLATEKQLQVPKDQGRKAVTKIIGYSTVLRKGPDGYWLPNQSLLEETAVIRATQQEALEALAYLADRKFQDHSRALTAKIARLRSLRNRARELVYKHAQLASKESHADQNETDQEPAQSG